MLDSPPDGAVHYTAAKGAQTKTLVRRPSQSLGTAMP